MFKSEDILRKRLQVEYFLTISRITDYNDLGMNYTAILSRNGTTPHGDNPVSLDFQFLQFVLINPLFGRYLEGKFYLITIIWDHIF